MCTFKESPRRPVTMKLDFIKKTDKTSESMMRLYDFDVLQARKFRDALERNIIVNNMQFDLIRLEFVKAIDCSLTFRLNMIDKGISTTDGKNFFCDLTMPAYKNMSALI